MNLFAAAVAISLSAAASTATVSAYSFSAKASKASSKGAKAKSTKTKASKAGSYSMSISLPNCKPDRLDYDTGSGEMKINLDPLITPEAGEAFDFFTYKSTSENWKCYKSAEPGIMLFFADNADAPDGTVAECIYEACYEEDCAPDCCCTNTITLMVDD
mmetsp:Transcript_7645/g.12601  ORF Transcript_7645/g.12601 Transcript_7645/m.12601 type:complete len:159 (+) Transcript_7645:120-596(+)